jgi:hypothetical protein
MRQKFDNYWGRDQKGGMKKMIRKIKFGNETQDDEEVYRFFFD